MYEDGGCIDDFGGVPRHFTPPGAGGWDRSFKVSPIPDKVVDLDMIYRKRYHLSFFLRRSIFRVA